MKTKSLYLQFAILAVMLLGSAGMANAYDFVEVWGVPIYYNVVNGEAIVTNNGQPNCYSGDLYLTDKVTHDGVTYPVTAIGDGAFMNCRYLNSVSLVPSIRSIGNKAFCNCTKMTFIDYFPDGLTTIGDYAFSGCSSLVVINLEMGMTRVNLGKGVVSIGKCAFKDCSKIKTLVLEDQLTTIGDSAFMNCTQLNNVTMGYATASIGTGAFAQCSNIRSFTCKADNPPVVGDETCFADFQDLAKLIVGYFAAPKYQAAEYWKEFKTVETFNDGIDGLYYEINGNQATITYRDQNYNSYSGNVVIPESFEYGGVTYHVTGIGDKAFMGCMGLTSVIIPSSVNKIGSYAFKGCMGLSGISLPREVTTINEHAFDSCGITAIIIPDAVTAIADGTFANCHKLETVILPETLTDIGKEAFYRCNSMKSIDLPETITTLEQGAFKSSGLTSFTLPPQITTISAELLRYTSNMETVTLHDKLTTIGSFSFANCGFSSIDIPLSVREIKANAFYSSYLTSIVIPDSVTTLGKKAFSNCIRMTNAHIGNGIKVIGDSTFYWSPYSPREVSFGDSSQLTTIGASAFAHNKLERIDLPKTVKSIGTRAFESCKSLKTIDLGDRLTAIAGHTFENSDALEEVKMPNTVKSIGEEAFSHCYNLKVINMSDSLTYISSYAFWQCRNLKRMRIPDMVTSIGYCLFDQCVSLEEVVFGQSLKTMGSLLFRGCSALKSVIMLNPTPPELNANNDWGNNVLVYTPEASRYRNAAVWQGFNLKGIYRQEDVRTSMATIAGDCGLPLTGAIFYRCDGDTITFEPQDNVIALKGLVPTHNDVAINFVATDGEQYRIKDVVVTDSIVFSNCHGEKIGSLFGPTFTITCDEEFVPDSCGVYYDYLKKDFLGSVIKSYRDSSVIQCQGLPIRPGWHYDVRPWVAYHGVIYQSETVRIKPTNYSDNSFPAADIYPTSVNMPTSSIIGTEHNVKKAYFVMDGKHYDRLQVTGLDPETAYHATCILYDDNGFDSIGFDFITPPLQMGGSEVRTLKQNTVMFKGWSNMADEETGSGIEWERVNVEGTTQQKPAYVFAGSLANIVNRIALSTPYRYRPYYKSQAGNVYYGEWQEFSITDAVGSYEPILYNYGTVKVTPTTATVRGLVLQGNNDVTSQGFTYNVNAWNADKLYISGSGQLMECTITGLKPNTGYWVHVSAYANHNYVSRDIYFATPAITVDVNCDGEVNIADVNAALDNILNGNDSDNADIDVNNDHEGNIADINAIINAILNQ
jgi:hypothetical protein